MLPLEEVFMRHLIKTIVSACALTQPFNSPAKCCRKRFVNGKLILELFLHKGKHTIPLHIYMCIFMCIIFVLWICQAKPDKCPKTQFQIHMDILQIQQIHEDIPCHESFVKQFIYYFILLLTHSHSYIGICITSVRLSKSLFGGFAL